MRKELEATDAVLGDPDAVRLFVLNAAQRLGIVIAPDRRPNVFRVTVSPEARATMPPAINAVLPITKSGHWFISFVSPTPEGAEYFGRNHRFVATLAQFLMEEALTKGAEARASRCGAMHPAKATWVHTIESYSEFGKCRLQETDRGIDVPHEEVSVLKPNSHRSTPKFTIIPSFIVLRGFITFERE